MPELIPRDCGTCSLCCKVFVVPEVDKLAGQWCQHHRVGKGCDIHADRPPVCRTFFCSYAQGLTPADCLPADTGVVIFTSPHYAGLTAVIDPPKAKTWRTGPVGRWLKSMAEAGTPIRLVIGNTAVQWGPGG